MMKILVFLYRSAVLFIDELFEELKFSWKDWSEFIDSEWERRSRK
jgi:hypothetical protein